jgi:hypothetical protein
MTRSGRPSAVLVFSFHRKGPSSRRSGALDLFFKFQLVLHSSFILAFFVHSSGMLFFLMHPLIMKLQPSLPHFTIGMNLSFLTHPFAFSGRSRMNGIQIGSAQPYGR